MNVNCQGTILDGGSTSTGMTSVKSHPVFIKDDTDNIYFIYIALIARLIVHGTTSLLVTGC